MTILKRLINSDFKIEIKQEFPEPGFVEIDPSEIYTTCIECIEKVCNKLDSMGISKHEIKSIGVSNQRETTVVWNRKTGKRKLFKFTYIFYILQLFTTLLYG